MPTGLWVAQIHWLPTSSDPQEEENQKMQKKGKREGEGEKVKRTDFFQNSLVGHINFLHEREGQRLWAAIMIVMLCGRPLSA